MHKNLTRIHMKLTRNQFESKLGGDWTQDDERPKVRRNGRWETWHGPSQKVQGRTDKFVKDLNSGRVHGARNWTGLAKALGL